jgi:hypothetical protein
VEELRLDGEVVEPLLADERLGRTVGAIPMSRLKHGVDHLIDARLGKPTRR